MSEQLEFDYSQMIEDLADINRMAAGFDLLKKEQPECLEYVLRNFYYLRSVTLRENVDKEEVNKLVANKSVSNEYPHTYLDFLIVSLPIVESSTQRSVLLRLIKAVVELQIFDLAAESELRTDYVKRLFGMRGMPITISSSIITLFLENGLDPNHVYVDGTTMLYRALKSLFTKNGAQLSPLDYYAILLAFKNHGGDTEAKIEGRTILEHTVHLASDGVWEDFINNPLAKSLVIHGMTIPEMGESLSNSIWGSVRTANDSRSVVELLKVPLPTGEYTIQTLLRRFTASAPHLVKSFVERGLDMSKPSAIFAVCSSTNIDALIDILQTCVDKGFSVTGEDEDGDTVFTWMFSALNEDADDYMKDEPKLYEKMVSEWGEDIDRENQEGETITYIYNKYIAGIDTPEDATLNKKIQLNWGNFLFRHGKGIQIPELVDEGWVLRRG